jgi:carbonic anhydrase/acetyltransferase-like protein (isoleucine patch superfamily)
MTIYSYDGKRPTVSKTSFVANNATIIGDVELREKSSVWFGAVIRSELAPTIIGKSSNVQDNCVVHTDIGYPVELGEGVTIGHAAVIHGAKIGSNCLVGMRSTLLNGASIGKNCIVAAGSLVTERTKIPDGSLVMGSPAILKRELNDEEIERIRVNSIHYDTFRETYLGKKVTLL